ncbi:NAD(P)/FAD-dependent oxidoreductase [Candidatus Njordibacter sp. Uisw_002]|uniref:NAD(P)/FAD-dependent oxidoreductase n=1 Tax=Candidatus Njordibacter sp. Uisw_002 TaxID=3230971 RepID=UPI003D5B0F11
MIALNTKKKRIAIIGSGISGQTCGYLLSKQNEVTLFEANNHLGGHTATIDLDIEGKTLPVDTGFIVFNDRTYPNFIKMMDQIGITSKPTEMSFSVHNKATGFEYNGHSLNTLFAQRRNLLSPRFYSFIFEILRFNKMAKKANASGETDLGTLGEFLDKHSFSDYFATHYVLAMTAAIWSASINSCRDFPLQFFLSFLTNHGLLDIANRPQWYVIEGGSRSYIKGLTQSIQDIRLGTPVQWVTRHCDHVEITSDKGTEVFDEVIFACHSDQALHLLNDPSQQESKVLGAMKYRSNDVVLHTDKTLLPKRKNAYASWNYCIDPQVDELPTLTYNMNILQGLKTNQDLCVTLNQTQNIDPAHILRQFTYSHPVFSLESIAAQKQRHTICGDNLTHFCGAYWYNGFHEDGVKSALDVCQRFGVTLDTMETNPLTASADA